MFAPSGNDRARHQTGTYRLRDLIRHGQLNFLMEAHDALSAAIAQRTGFRGLWASGLSISSTLGYRDANEASWTELVDVVRRIVGASSIPVLVDADSGFGNFNNARIVASRLHEAGAGGLCLEDKGFPKMNSFVGNRHPLADVTEFCGRLRAVKDAVNDSDFTLVARIEALIAGYGLSEAVDRADEYAEAGADAILIHSRRPDADEILAFADAWQGRLPIIIVPTKYYRTPVSRYREARISTVIWANHNMRAAVAAMQRVCHEIIASEGIAGVEPNVASLETIFDLLDYDELKGAEERYLPSAQSLAAE